MPEAYSLRSPENSDSTHDRRQPLAKVKNHRRNYHQRTEVCDLSPDNDKRTPSDDFIERDSHSFRRRPEFYHLSIEDTRTKIATCRPPPEFISEKRKSSIPCRQSSWNKSEMYYISTEDRKTPNDNRQSPCTNNHRRLLPSATYPTPPDSPSDRKATVYLLTTSNADAFRSSFSPSPSPPVSEYHEQSRRYCTMSL
jgi:hypothetical protein